MQIKNILFLATAVSAHFRLTTPQWRGDSLALATNNASISQWNYPCAGIGQENANRTDFPINGGQVSWNSSHEYAITFVNIGLGSTVNTFNISLLKNYNGTGAGVQCFPTLGRDVLTKLNISDGTQASLQVITISGSGASLFNCADITFRTNVTSSGECKNGTGVGGYIIQPQAAANGSASGSGSGSTTGAASRGVVPIAALLAAIGAAALASL